MSTLAEFNAIISQLTTCTNNGTLQLPLPVDIISYLVSEYIPYDELHSVDIHHLRVCPHRVVINKHTKEEYDEYGNEDPDDLVIVIVHYIDVQIDNTVRISRREFVNENYISEVLCYDVHGELHGTQWRWYTVDRPCTMRHYLHGTRHGVQRTWYHNGELETEEYYLHGRKYDVQREWHDNGMLYEECNNFVSQYYTVNYYWSTKGELYQQDYYESGSHISTERRKSQN